MIVLDTNVFSELVKEQPAAAVERWWSRISHRQVRLTSVLVAEVRYGIERMPTGRRRNELDEEVSRLIGAMSGRILPFDDLAGAVYGRLVAQCERHGRAITPFDGQIAAICIQSRATLATRNIADFQGLPLDLVDPWRT